MAKKSILYPTTTDVESVFKLNVADKTTVLRTADPRSVIHNFAHLNAQFNLRGIIVYGFNWGKNMTHFHIKEMNRRYAGQECICVPVLSTQLGFKGAAFYLIHVVCKKNNK